MRAATGSKGALGVLAAGLMAAGALAPAVVTVATVSLPTTTAAAGAAKFKSATAALQEGLTALQRGETQKAIPALEFAATNNVLIAQFTLAQIYSDNAGSETDHTKAYMLYQSIADEHSDADPDDDQRAPYIAKSLTALAGYLRVGISDIGLKPDLDRAADYLHHAALFFGDEDAQFELVKLKLKGEGVPEDIASAKHWLAVLTQRGHAGAQAFLADLYWRGKVMEQDKVRAFALITVAVAHAPPRERIWIEDVYQNIFCGAGEGIRKQATGMVADWSTRYGRKAQGEKPTGFDPLYPLTVRTCQNGEKVVPLTVQDVPTARSQSEVSPLRATPPAPSSYRDAGVRPVDGLPTPGFAHSLMPGPETSALGK
jgi:uncharacterized protein